MAPTVAPPRRPAARSQAALYSATTRSIKVTVQLRRRHWRITDALGRMQEVKGAGVVGEQPILGPGEMFEYTSGTPLPTPSGIMVGSYEMETKAGESFDVAVPAFSLDSPHQPIRLN